MQVARTGVIAEPLPGMQHVVEGSLGQRFEARKPRHKAVKISSYRRDGGLLQNDLVEPDVGWFGCLAGLGAPRQHAAMPVVPTQQRWRDGCGLVDGFYRGRAHRDRALGSLGRNPSTTA